MWKGLSCILRENEGEAISKGSQLHSYLISLLEDWVAFMEFGKQRNDL